MAAQLDVALDKPLPQSPDAERAVLGACLTSTGAFWRICNMIKQSDFFKDAHRTIYAAMLQLSGDGEPIDLLTVKTKLWRMEALENVGGGAYVSSLTESPPDVANVEKYAQIVKRAANKRAHLMLGNAMMRASMEPSSEPEDVASMALSALANEGTSDRKAESLYDITIDVETRKRERLNSGRQRVIPTNFDTLDRNQIVRREALTIIAAPTHHGKSTFLLNLTAGALRGTQTARAAFYSLEMSDEEITESMLSILSGVLIKRIQNRTMNEIDAHAVSEALDKLQRWRDRIFFADRIRDFESIHADCRRLKATYGLDVVFIDYLQLMGGFDDLSGEREVNRIGRGLKRMAQDLDLAVVAASQVNKEREKRASKRLSIGDMKYGAVIGEHADVALMFQRPRQDDQANTDIKWCEMVFQVAKNRGHENGDVLMHADMPTQTFAEGDCKDNRCRWLQTSESQLKL